MYCNRVIQVIDQLGINVEIRNIWENRDYEKELVTATGRKVVPVLSINEADGQITWLSESGDIIRYLVEQTANS